ncbi:MULTISPECIES: acyl-CoA dehydratase activase [Sporomusa]|uniref:Activator of (R)-2-hydroxyglutaryl-CoA dehydratase n=2 Tax=Sporomusa TaxID=2375 RepID=A0ABM9W9G8_9FIRM|nr:MULTISPECIES: acyl-CoA dehydratase activase [Sporomusa]OLS56854.1 activator of (R)-2-hydroxyglutaryl-CoA dehydratase [Sporomusa sphaeroides DSM 2875]CVK21784.1 Activator of (R)-2-hydroxyglutaryl-CoA dehydratase [Sporomusa sphaeroides DSM 2875]SCM81877.1 CoA-substrate-specific enzyme activase [uncultured Sporomusa sp.]
MQVYLGIDVGSVSTNVAVLRQEGSVVDSLYIRTRGKPIEAVQTGLQEIKQRLGDAEVLGVGTTGSGRYLTGMVVGADSIKNEITAHAIAAMHIVPDVRTVLEIGGQDSKLIIIRNGIVTDFAMNTVCAAGTGSFLDQQASRLNIPISQFGELALTATAPVRIAGRCAVFAESDMIHKQQTGHAISDILQGLCQALVRNYLSNVGKGKQVTGPVVFQGGVAANKGMQRAFEDALQCPVVVPPYYNVMGAIGAALAAREEVAGKGVSAFKGFTALEAAYTTRSFECSGCANLCEVIELKADEAILGRWGDRCGKWTQSALERTAAEEGEPACVFA